MNPDVAAAVDNLERRGILTSAQAERPRRAARGEILSLRPELSVLLYGGVLLATAGAGLLVKNNLTSIGPLGIALGLGIAAFGSLAWVAMHAPSFSWGKAPSPHLAFDYILLLGMLLGAADLAFIEVEFTPLGANWPWHLLLVSLVGFALSIRYDSRAALSLALSSFAAWRGVSVSFLEWNWWSASEEALRANMIVCALVFLALGELFVRMDRKAHFEPVATAMGWILLLGALFSGMLSDVLSWALVYAAVLLGAGGFLAWRALRRGTFPLFALGIVGAYSGLCGFVVRGLIPDIDALLFGWFLISSLVVLGALVLGHRAMRRAR